MIYLDYSATTPMSEKAIETYAKVAKDYFGNASSLHDFGGMASNITEHSRRIISKHINCSERGLFFTSGGSESNHLAILSLAHGNLHKGKHLITSKVEHPSVLNAFKVLEREGFKVTYIPVNRFGQIEIKTFENALQSDTILVSIGHASSELGTIQDIEKIGEILYKRGIAFHSDCVQTFGKIPLDITKAKLTSVSLSAHKIYGPKGIGACYMDPSTAWRSTIPNVSHEKGFRQGTLNVPAIAAFAEACEEIMSQLTEEQKRLRELQFLFLSQVDKSIILEGHPQKRLPHHLCLRLKGIEGQYVMLECNRNGIAISTGSACKIGQSGPPLSMTAIGRTPDEGREMIRITLGKYTTKDHIEKVASVLNQTMHTFYTKNKERGIT